MPNELNYSITPEMVYGKEFNTLIPADMEVVAFAPPAKGDLVLRANGMLITFRDECGPLEPRLILRKKKNKKIIFTFSHRGKPKKGEWVVSDRNSESVVIVLADSSVECDIYTREIVEE